MVVIQNYKLNIILVYDPKRFGGFIFSLLILPFILFI